MPEASVGATVVRACAKCGQPAVLQVFQWTHTHGDRPTGETTRELRCQACGVWFKIHPHSQVLAYWILGGLFTPAFLVGGLPFFYVAWRRSTMERRIPIVPGAAVPALRFPAGPPRRSCGVCSTAASAVKVERDRYGTVYSYACPSCGKSFETESFVQHLFALFSSVVIGAIAVAFLVFAESPGWRFGAPVIPGLLAGFMAVHSGNRLMNRFRHPPIETV